MLKKEVSMSDQEKAILGKYVGWANVISQEDGIDVSAIGVTACLTCSGSGPSGGSGGSCGCSAGDGDGDD